MAWGAQKAWALVATLACCACGTSSAAAPRTLVFAASSLTESFQRLALAFEQEHPGRALDLHFAGTPRLVLQVREGAAVDVFAAADTTLMRRVMDLDGAAKTPRIFAHNRLAIAVAKGNPCDISGLADLARHNLKVALCGPEVPAGRYARQALRKAGVTLQSVSDEPSVRALLSKVKLGELDAGIVYATDLGPDCEAVTELALPGDFNVIASYPISVLSSGSNAQTAELFVEFVLSGSGQRILQSLGFETP